MDIHTNSAERQAHAACRNVTAEHCGKQAPTPQPSLFSFSYFSQIIPDSPFLSLLPDAARLSLSLSLSMPGQSAACSLCSPKPTVLVAGTGSASVAAGCLAPLSLYARHFSI